MPPLLALPRCPSAPLSELQLEKSPRFGSCGVSDIHRLFLHLRARLRVAFR